MLAPIGRTARPCYFCYRHTLEYRANDVAQCPLCKCWTYYDPKLERREQAIRFIRTPRGQTWTSSSGDPGMQLHDTGIKDEDVFLELDPTILALFAQALGVTPQALHGHYSIDCSPYRGGDLAITLWRTDVPFSSAAAAEILDCSVDWIGRLAKRGVFTGAFRATPSKKQYERGRWLIPAEALHDVVADATYGSVRPPESRKGLGAKIDALINLHLDIGQHLGDQPVEGLSASIELLDRMIIANTRLQVLQTQGLVESSDPGFPMPDFKCSPRLYIFDTGSDEDEDGIDRVVAMLPLADSDLVDEDTGEISAKGARLIGRRINRIIHAIGNRHHYHECWMLWNANATVFEVEPESADPPPPAPRGRAKKTERELRGRRAATA